MLLPLNGIRILDFSRLLPGPFCSLMFVDLGAEVVKVEQPEEGDYLRWMPPFVNDLSAGFIALNRGKKSIALDLQQESARDAVRTLVPHFDVVLESFRPGVMHRLGLDYDTLKALHPGLIYCSISGYGQTGPLSHKAGHDINYLALSGVLGTSGPPASAPTLSSVQIADLAGGAYPAAVAILAALFQRHQTGTGQFLDISMTEGALSLMAFHFARYFASDDPLQPENMPLSGGSVNYGAYLTEDGRALAVGALEPKFWFKLLEHLDRHDLDGAIASSNENREQARSAFAAVIASRTLTEWHHFFDDLDVCCEPVLQAPEVAHHPMHLARGMIREVEVPQGEPLRSLVTPFPFLREQALQSLLDDGNLNLLPPAPELGQHTHQIFADIGLSDSDIQAILSRRER